jgi:hypothetical protein
MRPLRRFGNGFAICVSAILFALLHKNFVQAPMALVAGLGLGYAAVRTETLWVPMAIHAFNNAVSVGVGLAVQRMEPEIFNRYMSLYTVSILLLGGVSAVWLIRTRPDAPPRPPHAASRFCLALRYLFSTWQMAGAVLFLAVCFALNL